MNKKLALVILTALVGISGCTTTVVRQSTHSAQYKQEKARQLAWRKAHQNDKPVHEFRRNDRGSFVAVETTYGPVTTFKEVM